MGSSLITKFKSAVPLMFCGVTTGQLIPSPGLSFPICKIMGMSWSD